MNGVRLGIDAGGENLPAVRTGTREDGTIVYELMEGIDQPPESEGGYEIHLAVPEHQASIKTIAFEPEPDLPLEAQILFELQQTQLDSPDQFKFDYLKLRGENQYLGVIYRRQVLAELSSLIPYDDNLGTKKLGYRLRSIALGNAYLHFAGKDQGGEEVLIDISDSVASLCFLKDGQIVGVAGLPLVDRDLNREQDLLDFATDLKTLLSYKLSTFEGSDCFGTDYGLRINHGLLSPDLEAALESRFSVCPERIQLDKDALALIANETGLEPERYLVCLGLVC